MDTTTHLSPAEVEYFKHDQACNDAVDALRTERDPARRAELLDVLAVNDEHQATLHTRVYGLEPNPDEGGRPHAESLASSAVLLRALAATERALSTSQPREHATDERVEKAGGALLDELAAEADPYNRAAITDELFDVVEPVVGGQAAESLACQAHRYEDVSHLA